MEGYCDKAHCKSYKEACAKSPEAVKWRIREDYSHIKKIQRGTNREAIVKIIEKVVEKELADIPQTCRQTLSIC